MAIIRYGIMTEARKQYRLSRNEPIICSLCKQIIITREKIIFKRGGRVKPKLYHIKCAKQVNVI